MGENKNFITVATKMDFVKFVSNLKEKTLLIYSPTSIKKIQLKQNKNIDMVSWHEIGKNIDDIELFLQNKKKYKYIIAVGGGSPIDIAKYVSYKLNNCFICVPTMLSTNSYATDKSALIENNKKVTIQVKLADKIIIDENIIKNNPRENLYGLADILSIYTALYDWNISCKYNNEIIDQKIYIMASKLLKDTINFIQKNTIEEIGNDIFTLFKHIGTSGYITNIYGSGRPESGSEHIMAKAIESDININHGISVSIGILIMSMLQNRLSKNIIQCIKKIEVLHDIESVGITRELLKKELLTIEPREDRYSIVNCFRKEEKHIDVLIDDFYKCIG